MLLKLVELPSDTFPIQSSKRTGSIVGLSIYHAIGLALVLVNGIEMSMGFEKSTSKVWLLWLMVAFICFLVAGQLCHEGAKSQIILILKEKNVFVNTSSRLCGKFTRLSIPNL